jgi:hypothetical protein
VAFSKPYRLSLIFVIFGLCGAAAFDAPQVFVQRFYDWYAPRASTLNWSDALKSKRSLFDLNLANALRADAEAQAKVSGDIDGLDFDPFLGSQDPETKYLAANAVRTPAGYRVEVYAGTSRKRGVKSDVTVDLAMRGGDWVITDFRYPVGHDLLTTLRLLREERERRAKIRK